MLPLFFFANAYGSQFRLLFLWAGSSYQHPAVLGWDGTTRSFSLIQNHRWALARSTKKTSSFSLLPGISLFASPHTLAYLFRFSL